MLERLYLLFYLSDIATVKCNKLFYYNQWKHISCFLIFSRRLWSPWVQVSRVLNFNLFLHCKVQCLTPVGDSQNCKRREVININRGGGERDRRKSCRWCKRMIVETEREGKVEIEAKRKRRGRNMCICQGEGNREQTKVVNPFLPISPSNQNVLLYPETFNLHITFNLHLSWIEWPYLAVSQKLVIYQLFFIDKFGVFRIE